MKVKCSNIFNDIEYLTENKEYDVIKQEGPFGADNVGFEIVADDGDVIYILYSHSQTTPCAHTNSFWEIVE